MKKIITQLLTGADNQTHDIGRWMAAISGLSGIFYEGYAVIVMHTPFSMQDFGIGVGALAAGIGSMLKLKEDTEPKDAA